MPNVRKERSAVEAKKDGTGRGTETEGTVPETVIDDEIEAANGTAAKTVVVEAAADVETEVGSAEIIGGEGRVLLDITDVNQHQSHHEYCFHRFPLAANEHSLMPCTITCNK